MVCDHFPFLFCEIKVTYSRHNLIYYEFFYYFKEIKGMIGKLFFLTLFILIVFSRRMFPRIP